MKRVVVNLNATELQNCKKVAHDRQANKEDFSVATRKYAERFSDQDLHNMGVQTEFAVAKYLGIDIDRTISPSGDDKIKDLQYGNVTIQVRARNKRADGDLFFNNLEDFQADVAVLVIFYEDAKMEIVGWSSKQNFKDHHYINNFGHGNRACLTQNFLRDMEELKQARTIEVTIVDLSKKEQTHHAITPQDLPCVC